MAWGYIVVRKQSWVMERPRPITTSESLDPDTQRAQQRPPCTAEVTIWAALHGPLFYSEVKY